MIKDFRNNNLLVISDTYANFVKDQVEALSKYFNHIFVLVKHNPIADIAEYININYLKPFRASSIVDLKNKPENISVIMTDVVYAPTQNQYKKLGDKHYKAVDSIIEKNNIEFDIVHAHFTWSNGYVGAKIKNKYNCPLIITAHGFDIYKLPFQSSYWSEKIGEVLNVSDCIITVSQNNVNCINKLNVNTPVKVIYNGFRDDLFNLQDKEKCRKILGLPNNKKIVLTIGHLVEVKGHYFLIEAMKEVVKYRKDVLCIIVGVGKLKSALENQIKKAKLDKHVILVGEKPHDEIPIWMGACDVFVLPSLNEGNPTVMFECLGCGRPFIGTKVGGIPEIITSEKYGLLCKPEDLQELSNNILIALNKYWNADSIIKYASQYNWDNIATEIIKVYERAFKKHKNLNT